MKVAALLSRHEPTEAMKSDMMRRGYRIVQINPPGRLYSAQDAIALMTNRNNGVLPDVVIVAIATGILKHLVREIGGYRTILRPVMDHNCQPPRWTGMWEEVERVEVVTKLWDGKVKELSQ